MTLLVARHSVHGSLDADGGPKLQQELHQLCIILGSFTERELRSDQRLWQVRFQGLFSPWVVNQSEIAPASPAGFKISVSQAFILEGDVSNGTPQYVL